MADANHPDILREGVAIVSALPPAEAASAAYLAVDWMRRCGEPLNMLSAPPFVMRLAAGGEAEAALLVASEVLRLWSEGGKLRSHFSQHMYEHYLPGLRQALTVCCGRGALTLLVDCLDQALTAGGHDTPRHVPTHPIWHDAKPHQDVVEALTAAVRETAWELARGGVATIADVVTVIGAKEGRIFARLALHLLAQDPASAPGLATSRLLNEGLSTEEWCGWEYSELAAAWFPSMTPEEQAAVLAAVDAVPGRYVEGWKARFAEREGRPPSLAEIADFGINCTQDLLWRWRAVLPPERRRQVEAKGDPNAWRGPRAHQDESRERTVDFSSMPVDQIVRLLDGLRPASDASPSDPARLGQKLRSAATFEPERFATAARQFAGSHPHHLQCLFDGLQETASKGTLTAWDGVLSLSSSTFGRARECRDAGAEVTPAWSRACEAAGDLLLTGLRLGASGIPAGHEPAVRALLAQAAELAPVMAVAQDFEERFGRHPFFAARASFKGMVTEACILLIHWRTKVAPPSGHDTARRLAQEPEATGMLDRQLAERGAGGRVPRAVIGRYLRYLQHLDPEWFASRQPVFFPSGAPALRQATWDAHLTSDDGPVAAMTPELERCYDEEIATSLLERPPGSGDDHRQRRFGEYLLIMVLRDEAPPTLLARFLEVASSQLRGHVMWWLGNQLSDAIVRLPAEMRLRGQAYWERRLAAAAASLDPREHQAEFGVIDLWCLHGTLDELWLAEQLLRMFDASLVPDQGHHVMGWLPGLSASHPDLAVEVLLGFVRQAHRNRWLFTSSHAQIRSVLSAGRATANPETIHRISRIANRLASIGEPAFLDFDPAPPSG